MKAWIWIFTDRKLVTHWQNRDILVPFFVFAFGNFLNSFCFVVENGFTPNSRPHVSKNDWNTRIENV
ncbi:hypothetical protein BC833DRAFT_579243 [Globomyces pollinis-pini]|nr:hypothetical protein BC833DRAFT_579243 [Globomyces pollinis-pini]